MTTEAQSARPPADETRAEQDRRDVVVVNTWERGNRGDAVLLHAVIQQIERAYDRPRIRIAGIEDPRDHPDFGGVENLGSARRWMTDPAVPRWRRYLRRAAAVGLFGLFSVPGSGRLAGRVADRCPDEVASEIRAVTEADVVVSSAGGYFLGGPSLERTLLLAGVAYPLWLARAAGVRSVYAPQSFGPFEGPVQRGIVRRLLSGAGATVLAREAISVTHLRDLGIEATPAVDPAFAFVGDVEVTPDGVGLPAHDHLVLVTARQWLAPAEQARFESELGAALREIVAADPGTVVAFVPQVTCEVQTDDDRPVHARVAELVGPSERVVQLGADLDHRQVWALYGHADVVIGTRFHSVIFGLTHQVPAIAVQYEHKTRGIMRDLDLEQWVLDMEEVTADRVLALYRRLQEDEGVYRAHLAARIPGYVEQAGSGVVAALTADDEAARLRAGAPR